jgi:hypothetical protein
MPVEIATKERPQQLCSNKSLMKCGTLLFWRGLYHEDGHHIPNAGVLEQEQHQHTRRAACEDSHSRLP